MPVQVVGKIGVESGELRRGGEGRVAEGGRRGESCMVGRRGESCLGEEEGNKIAAKISKKERVTYIHTSLFA